MYVHDLIITEINVHDWVIKSSIILYYMYLFVYELEHTFKVIWTSLTGACYSSHSTRKKTWRAVFWLYGHILDTSPNSSNFLIPV